jgi:hypothetical protein
MRYSILVLATISCVAVPAVGAMAEGKSECAPGKNQDALVAFYSGTGSPTPGESVDTLGGALSGGFYGNTSNAGIDVDAPDSGHGVTPSISPGPQVVNGGGPGTGTSIGDSINFFCPPT